MKDMSQIDLKFDSEQNAFGLTDDFDDLYIPKKASRLQTAGFQLYQISIRIKLQLKIHINLITFILLNTQIMLRDFIGRVIVDVHQQSRWCAVLPGVISKCLSQRVTADMFILNCLLGSSPYNSVCLNSVQWLPPAGGFCKNKLMFSRMPFVEICPESIGGIAVQSDIVILAGLLLVDKKMRAKYMMLEIVYVIPLQFKQVTDSQCCV